MNRAAKVRWAAGLTVLIALIILPFLLIDGDSSSVIKIGAILPMTGGAAQYGEDARRGIDIAIDELNDAGGINGKRVVLELEDSGTEPRTAILAFKKLTMSKDMQVVLTEVSGVVLALAPEANKKEIILFNVGAQNPKIREAGPYVFSNINDASIESKQVAEFAFEQLDAKNAAVLYSDAAYGEGARSVFSSRFRELGGAIVAEVSFPEDGLDYRAHVLEIREAKPEVVFLPGLTKDMAKILKQAYELGYKPQWLSYTAFEGEDIIRIAGEAAEGVIYSHQSTRLDGATQRAKRFVEAFRDKYSVDPGIYSATGYDGIMIAAQAIASTGNDGPKLKEYFLTMPPFDGASGPTSFLANGAVEKPLTFRTVRDGKFVEFSSSRGLP